MNDNYITIGNFTLFEPTTVLTDVIVSILCIYICVTLRKNTLSDIQKMWTLFFLFFGLSTLVGGCSHAFYQIHEGVGYKLFWLTMQIFNGAAVMFAQLATYTKKAKQILVIQFIVFVFAVLFFQKFIVVIINNIISLIPVMLLNFQKEKKAIFNKKIAYGILISFAPALIHGFKISFHTFFNYNDIAHIFIMLSLYIIFSGVNELENKFILF